MNSAINTIWINKFDSVRDTLAYPMDASWDVLIDYFLSGHKSFPNKEDAPLFNLVKYKTQTGATRAKEDYSAVRRAQANIEQVDALVVDYDGEITIGDAKDRFKDYEYIGYTSFSHLQTPGIEKFRLIFKLASPIPAWIKQNKSGSISAAGDYFYILEALTNFAGPCDKVIKNPSQMFYIPTCHPERKADARSWYNGGISLDWTTFPRNALSIRSDHFHKIPKKDSSKTTGLFLTPDQVIQTSGGPIRARDVHGRVSKVLCPFHDDKNGTEFINRSPKGYVYLYCRRCERSYFMVEDDVNPTEKPLQPQKILRRSDTLRISPDAGHPFHVMPVGDFT